MGRPAFGLSEAECAVIAKRLTALLDANGWDADDVARKVGVSIPRARFLLQGEMPEPNEYGRIIAMLEWNGV